MCKMTKIASPFLPPAGGDERIIDKTLKRLYNKTKRRIQMPYNEAAKKATAKYIKEKRDQLNLSMAKGMKEIYRTQAEQHGMSLNAYIISLLEKDREKSV